MKVRRNLIGMLSAAMFGLVTMSSVNAQGVYPEKQITVIVPQAAGGASDLIVRIVANKMSGILKQGIIVDNRAGAGGNIGTVAAARAKPDGYTLLFNVSSGHLINPHLYKNAGFSPEKDFVAIAPFATAGVVLVASPTFAPNTVRELIDLAKKNPTEVTYASAGNGTLNHLMGELFNKAAGIKMEHIPYKGAAAATTDVLAGRVPIAFQALASASGFIKAGKLKVLAVANPKRLEDLPNVPAISETLPGYGETPWYGLFAPIGTPKVIVDALHAATEQALKDPVVIKGLADLGAKPYLSSPAEFQQFISREAVRWKKIVAESGASVD